jgi:hypothetical protein
MAAAVADDAAVRTADLRARDLRARSRRPPAYVGHGGAAGLAGRAGAAIDDAAAAVRERPAARSRTSLTLGSLAARAVRRRVAGDIDGTVACPVGSTVARAPRRRRSAGARTREDDDDCDEVPAACCDIRSSKDFVQFAPISVQNLGGVGDDLVQDRNRSVALDSSNRAAAVAQFARAVPAICTSGSVGRSRVLRPSVLVLARGKLRASRGDGRPRSTTSSAERPALRRRRRGRARSAPC